MGWTSAPSWRSIEDVVRDELPSLTFAYALEPEDSRRGELWVEQVVVERALHGGAGEARLWTVCEQTGRAHKDGVMMWSERYVRLDLIEARGGFWVKTMDEHAGPCFYDCPVRFLDAAGPLDERITYAQPWRAKVREWWASNPRPIVHVLPIPEGL